MLRNVKAYAYRKAGNVKAHAYKKYQNIKRSTIEKLLEYFKVNSTDKAKVMRAYNGYKNSLNSKNTKKAYNASYNLVNSVISIAEKKARPAAKPVNSNPVSNSFKRGIVNRTIYMGPGFITRMKLRELGLMKYYSNQNKLTNK